MEPLYPDNLNPNPSGVPSGPPSPPTRKKWTKIILVMLAAIVVVAAVIIFVISQNNNNSGTSGGSVYYDRSGFDRTQLSEAIGDPAPLITEGGGTAANYKGTVIIQACNLLTVEDIRKLGQQIAPNNAPNVERNYIDGQSQGDTRAFSTSLASADNSNSCSYPLYKPEGSRVTVEVYQPPYNLPSAIDYELSRLYQEDGNVEGYTRYLQEVEGRQYFFLRDGNSGLMITLRDLADDQLVQKIVATVAANYKREAAAPKAPLRFAYDTPAFTKDYLNTCEVVTARDAESLFGGPAKPFAREQVASATNVIQFGSEDTATRFSNIRHNCARQAVSDGLSNKKVLTVEGISFTHASGAELQMASGRQLDEGVIEVSANIGDDAYFSQTTGENPELVVRKGRFVINLSILDQTRPNMNDDEMIAALTPIAQSAVSRIKD